MIYGKNILALIPARGGSKGIKNKNIYNLNGKPLISYTIEEAQRSKYIDNIVLSSDSNEIAEVAKQYGCRVPFLRPMHLAGDFSKTIDAVLHTIMFLKDLNEYYDILILLQPTQPLRIAKDIDGAIELFFKNNFKSLLSVCEIKEHPILMRSLENNNELIKLQSSNSTVRRQDMTKLFKVNGAIYINLISEINNETSFNDNKYGYVMPQDRSIDIDEPIDLLIAETLLKNRSDLLDQKE